MDELPAAPLGQAFKILSGVRVLDLTTSLAGPYGTMLLGDLDADVVKVERVQGGDESRSWGPPFLSEESLWFLSVNRNKRSVTLDYSTRIGHEILQRLVANSDVLITNFRQPTLQRMRLDFEEARQLRSDLIYCTVTAFGQTGPRRALPGYDLIAEGYSGVMDLTGEPGSPPQKVGTPAADLLAGMDLAFAVLAALFDRQRTGKGHQIDVSLADSMTRFLTPRVVSYLGSGQLPRRSGGRDSVIAVYEVFETADEPMTLALASDAIFRRFCASIERPDLASNPEYATNVDRRARRSDLVSLIQQTLRSRTRTYWLEKFAAADIPAGPINRLDEVVVDRQMIARSLFYKIASGRGIPQVNTPWHLDGAPNSCRIPPPKLGAATDEVLREWAGMTDREIADARKAGTI